MMEGGGRGRRPVLLGDDPEMGHMMQAERIINQERDKL